MSSLQKFNTTLEDFDKEVTKLKAVSEAYQKLEALVKSYDKISEQFNDNSKTLEKINELYKAHQEKITNALSALEDLSQKQHIELSKLIEKETEQIRKENREFYKELESTIKIKLDDNKSQIKQLIENERIQIKQIFEIEFAKNTKELKQTFETEIQKQTSVILRGHKSIRIPLWTIGCITLTILILTLCRFFMIA